MMMEKVKNHKYREDLYVNIVLKKDSEIDLKERAEIKRILRDEINILTEINSINNILQNIKKKNKTKI